LIYSPLSRASSGDFSAGAPNEDVGTIRSNDGRKIPYGRREMKVRARIVSLDEVL
jgi:hypothetical protein